MRIEKLTLRNFKQYKDQTIEFPEGLIGFVGRNGAGKSTIFEGIYNCLFGGYDKDKGRIKNDLADQKESVCLSLQFEDKGKNYNIRREYRGKNLIAVAELYCDDKLIVSGAKDTTKALVKILKIDRQNFKNSFFSQQKEVTALLTSSKSDRQTQLRKMLGLSKLDTLEERIKKEEKNISERIDAREMDVLTEEMVKELNEQLKEYKVNEQMMDTSLSKEKSKYDSLCREYDDAKKEVANLEILRSQNDELVTGVKIIKSNLDQNKERSSELKTEIASLEREKKKLPKLKIKKDKYDSLEKEINSLIEKRSKYEQKEELEEEIERLKKQKTQKESQLLEGIKRVAPFEKISADLKVLEKQKTNLALELSEIENENKAKSNSLAAFKKGLENITARREKIEKIGKKSPCPECERPLNEHYDFLIERYAELTNESSEKIDLLTRELNQINIALAVKKNKSEEIEAKIRKAESDISKIEQIIESNEIAKEEIEGLLVELKEKEKKHKALTKLSFDPDQLEKAEEERENLSEAAEEYIALLSDVERIPVLEKDLKAIEKAVVEYAEEIEKKESEIAALKYDYKKYDKAKEKREHLEEKKNELNGKIAEAKEKLSECKYEIKSIEKRLSDDNKLHKEIASLRSEVNMHTRLRAFINDYKGKLTSRELPAISDEASRLFSQITKGRYNDLRITDDFEFSVNREGFDVPLETLSGGEKDLAGLCLRVAVSKRIASLAGRKNMGFLALDEVFGSQDEHRREELLKTLHPISKDFKQIFVISHNGDVHSAFETNLIIKKEGNYSKVEVVHNN